MGLRTLSALALVLCCCVDFLHAAEIGKGPAMRVAGVHSFEAITPDNSATIQWTVDKELYSSYTGKLIRAMPAYFSATGSKVSFDLKAAPIGQTVYVVKATDGAHVVSERVTVLRADRKISFLYSDPRFPVMKVYAVVPSTLNANTRLLVVMHSVTRDASTYCGRWLEYAAERDTLVLCPYFSERDWPGDTSYAQGNVFTDESNTVLNPESKWAFTVVDALHHYARGKFGLARDDFDLWGHSGGAQFVHRFMLFKPRAKVRIAMAANAGFYFLPVVDEPFPCGPSHPLLQVGHDDLIAWSDRRLVLFLGTEDINPRTPPHGACADEQGTGRYARGINMYQRMVAFNPHTRWKRIDVPGVTHDDRKMAFAAQEYLKGIHDAGE